MSLILLWGLPADRPFARVAEALARRGAPVVLLDQRDGGTARGELSVGPDVTGWLHWGDREVNLGSVTAAYMRGYDFRRLPAAADGPESEPWRRFVAMEDLLNSWADVTPARVVNRPSAMAANGSKPFQASWLRDLGFQTPDTLITTDPAIATAFWDRHRQVIYKSVSGIRSIVSRLAESDRGRLPDVAWCPTQFQEFVPGEDVRVHVVGSTIFACRITASVDDYRYSDGTAGLSPFDLPDEIRGRCLAASSAMGLPFCGIDLRRTPDGNWYAFEVNPSPGFSFYEYDTGHRIDEAVADLLIERPNWSVDLASPGAAGAPAEGIPSERRV
jgi:hypothetical protein